MSNAMFDKGKHTHLFLQLYAFSRHFYTLCVANFHWLHIYLTTNEHSIFALFYTLQDKYSNSHMSLARKKKKQKDIQIFCENDFYRCLTEIIKKSTYVESLDNKHPWRPRKMVVQLKTPLCLEIALSQKTESL